ncbi:1-hydroxycarotenoid 3,4-desaturase CrtD [Elioraea sp.]|uniref:1-hydroxycarotenoid 3,4-desaturase CrtD n=1 Tax=Elioraea sp. TaxID=2185103 RepID=UPI003F70F18E
MRDDRVVVIGAGMGGLTAALLLAARGLVVTVIERTAAPGGKMREVAIGEAQIDAGPTVFTMRWVLDEILAEAGAQLDDHLTLCPAAILARHTWDGGGALDLHAEIARSADAIGAFAGVAEAQGFRDFCARARAVYASLERPFLRAARPTPISLAARAGIGGMRDLWGASPFALLWDALGDHFRDPRLRQLFGRYATYCGSSPFAAPATLMLIAHVEQEGVWLVEGGMHRVARTLAALAEARGATFRYGAEVAEILAEHGRVAGVRLTTGERLAADAVVANADVAALAAGLFGGTALRAVAPTDDAVRSLSAITWTLHARASGFPLARHTVFFSRDYAAEFDALFARGRLPAEPTVYVCAQDRDDTAAAPGGRERLLVLVNAPPTGDLAPPSPQEIASCEQATFALLARSGLTIERRPETTVMTTPDQFARMFPATGGALYGRAVHGWRASFRRPGAVTKLPGLVLAGGSVHPGPGVPMAAMSGRLAAAAVLADLASMRRSHRAAMPGGMSMR